MPYKVLLGVVDKNSVIRFESYDNQECAKFLRRLGMTCDSMGWHGEGYIGSITYNNGKWSAAAFKSDVLEPKVRMATL